MHIDALDQTVTEEGDQPDLGFMVNFDFDLFQTKCIPSFDMAWREEHGDA